MRTPARRRLMALLSGPLDPPVGELPAELRGRQDLLTELLKPPAAGSSVLRVLTGPAGGGKSTVALAVARAARAKLWQVWWVPASDPASFAADLAVVKREAERRTAEVTAITSGLPVPAGLRRWLRPRLGDRWLLVVDDADESAAQALRDAAVTGGGWAELADGGIVLMTSRTADGQGWGPAAVQVRLPELDERSAGLLLLDRMGRADDAKELLPAATEVANHLGRLPMALHLAGRYLGSGVAKVELPDFRDLLAARPLVTVDEAATGWSVDDPRHCVLATADVVLNALRRPGGVPARSVLRVLSFLAAGSVLPVAMLDPEAFADAGLLPAGAGGRAKLVAALAGLRATGLVESVPVVGSGDDGLLVRPLVAEVFRVDAGRQRQRGVFQTAAARLVVGAGDRLDPTDPRDWAAWKGLTAHCLAVLADVAELDRELAEAVIGVNNALTVYLIERGPGPAVVDHGRAGGVDHSRAVAVDHGERVVAAAVRLLGDEHPAALRCGNNLASAYSQVGRFDEAIAVRRKVLATAERTRGAKHPETLKARQRLAATYHSAGRLEEASSLLRSTLAATRRALGANHPETLLAQERLARAYQDAGRPDEAITLYRATLAANRRTLGDGHPDTLSSQNNLAAAHQAAGRFVEAIRLYETTLRASERTLGDDHPDTLVWRNNLGYALHEAGQPERAIPLLEANLTRRERVLGDDHPDTLSARNNLALAYESVGRPAGAIALHEAALAASVRMLGDEHPKTLTSRNNLALAYSAGGRLDEAIPLHEATLTARERLLGENHLDSLISLNNLASAYHQAGRFDRSVPLLETALTRSERVLGDDHPHTLAARNNLGFAYLGVGRFDEAIPLLEAALAGRERVLGEEHPKTVRTRNNLAAAQHGRQGSG